MIRVAFFTQGGVARVGTTGYMPALAGVVSRLSKNFDITVYGTSTSEDDEGMFTCGNATVVLTRSRYSSPTLEKLWSLAQTFYQDHRKSPFDLLHGQWSLPGGFLAVVLGRLLGLPSIVSVMGADSASVHEINYGHLLRARTRTPVLWTCRRATAVTALTSFQEQQLRHHRLKRTDVHIIPFGADTALFFPSSPKPDPPPFNLLHVANLTEVKDQSTLLRAFGIISSVLDSRLRIIGPDYLKGKIQRLAESLGLGQKVEFLGRIENGALPAHYSWAHLLLHTSRHEGQGIVVAEAAACGTVTCGTRVGLIADLESRCTAAVDVGDYAGLAKKALDLLHNTERRGQLEKNSLAWAAEHTIDWTVRQVEQLYRELSTIRSAGGNGVREIKRH